MQPIVSAGDSSTVTITGKVLRGGGGVVWLALYESLCPLLAVLSLRQHLRGLRQRKGYELYLLLVVGESA
jgi:hypothetical protein